MLHIQAGGRHWPRRLLSTFPASLVPFRAEKLNSGFDLLTAFMHHLKLNLAISITKCYKEPHAWYCTYIENISTQGNYINTSEKWRTSKETLIMGVWWSNPKEHFRKVKYLEFSWMCLHILKFSSFIRSNVLSVAQLKYKNRCAHSRSHLINYQFSSKT